MTPAVESDAGFLDAIRADPADDGVRLIYADWLEERGDPRGEFVRVQCRVAELEAGCGCGRCVKRRGGGQHHNGPCAVDRERVYRPSGLRRRELELLEAHGRHWTPPQVCLAAGYELGSWPFSRPWTFRRGFVASITCTLAAWVGRPCPGCPFVEWGMPCTACSSTGRINARGPALVRAAPLERVVLSEPCDVSPHGEITTGRWRIGQGGASLLLPGPGGDPAGWPSRELLAWARQQP